MSSLRARLTLGVGVLIAVVLGLSGVLISNHAQRIAREALDDRLRRTAELLTATAVDAVTNEVPGTDRRLDGVLDATRSSLRLLIGDAVILAAGEELLAGQTDEPGLRTVTRDGERLRVLVVPLRGAGLGNLARLEVASSLADLERRQEELDRRLLLFGLAALLLAGLGTFVATVRALAPLRRLRLAAHRIAGEDDLGVRVPETDGPSEVRSLAASFNAMLARLSTAAEARQRALAATRRFALDAGHELRTPLTTVQAALSAVRRHPELAAGERDALLDDALEEHQRLVALLDGLQAYARGDAPVDAATEVDLAEVVAAEAGAASVPADIPATPVIVTGWEPGLRLLVANLIANAVRHGDGTVRVTLTADPPTLTVDDDGPGIPEADRERIFTPFTRLDAAAGTPGSGLGLALVAQQAREHGATVRVADAPGGGARFEVAFHVPGTYS